VRRSIIQRLALVSLFVSLTEHRAFAEELPSVPDGFSVSVFAREPLVRNPCAMAFDARGRLFVSQGPQYRSPTPATPGDRISILIDSDGDGVADRTKTFAEGLNHVQGMAWRGRDLWVANAPELTIVRDTDGDDEADEYVLVYGGLGNIEHALHGLNHAPDGRLYMSKGNSKGYGDAGSSELHVAPRPFAELWGMTLPNEARDTPVPLVFSKDTYKRGYHTPSDDWGTEGGVLRCDPDGRNLEIVSRGMRNPWDMAFDENFDWLLTDQDQDGGDRILSPFPGAHFGWGHHWSAHWTGENHLPTMPISGPVFHGSGTGIVYAASSQFPKQYRGVFFAADWLNRSIFVFRPRWDGALMRNMQAPEVFASAPKGRSLGSSSGMVFDPTDIEIGPDGALWVLSWGHHYGATIQDGKQVDEGRVYRITFDGSHSVPKSEPKYAQPLSSWTTEELLADLRHDRLPVRRINAQNELLRRGRTQQSRLAIVELLTERLNALSASAPNPTAGAPGAATWIAWTLGRIDVHDSMIDEYFSDRVLIGRLTQRIQSLRILGLRARMGEQPVPEAVAISLVDSEPQIRCAVVQAIHEAGDRSNLDAVWSLVATETDRATFYAAWRTLGKLSNESELRNRLTDERDGVRRAAILALLEAGHLSGDEAVKLRLDPDRAVAELASSFVEIVGTSAAPVIRIEPDGPARDGSMLVKLTVLEVPGTHARFTLSGSEPTDTNARRYSAPFRVTQGAEVQSALFRGRSRVGPVITATWAELSGTPARPSIDLPPLAAVSVSKLRAVSGSEYRTAFLKRGALAYTNRRYAFAAIPESLAGATIIQTANSDTDVGSKGEQFLTFHLAEDATVYVGHDRRIADRPDWLSAFEPSGLVLTTDDTSYKLVGKKFSAGEVVLGGNTVDGVASGRSQYVVAIAPLPITLEPLNEPTQLIDALSSIKSAHAGRGARLFFGAAACAKCHRLGDRGIALGPNLTKLGKRADAKTIVESILKPSAVIMEGFHTLIVVTKDGKSYSGFIRQETGLKLDLVQADGKQISISKPNIELRRRQNTSAMPADMAKLLSPQHVADLSAFILAYNPDPPENPASGGRRSAGNSKPHGGRRADTLRSPAGDSWGDSEKDFYLKQRDGAFDIQLDGKPIASFVYKHDKVKRPFFAHVKTSSGIQVTRRYPPVEGKDSTDHADMHPGLWLAFARLNDISFWHNSAGLVIHEGFTGEPQAGDSALFATRDRYVAPDGKVLCRQHTRYRIRKDPAGWLIDLHAEFTSDKPFWFGVREEMGLGVRVATPIMVRGGSGSILSSTGGRNEKGTWGKLANWWDYSGPITDRHVGVMILSPASNPDVWSHSRDYGVLVANPFPVDRAENRSKRRTVLPGRSFRLRFGVLIHDHPAESEFDRSAARMRFTNSIRAP
jgi:putative membrane-bound dehydrogenase-like protein